MARRPREQQSRLSFTPLPSSSPATKGYHKQIQDRAAAVTIQGSAGKRKRRDSDAAAGGLNDSMPTPAATLERGRGNRIVGTGMPPDDEDDSDDLPPLPSQKKRKTSRQQRIDFSNTREAGSFDDPVRLSSSARNDSSTARGIFGSQKRRATVVSSDEESEDELASPATIIRQKKGRKLARSSGPESGRITRSNRRSSRAQQDSEDEQERLAVSSPRQLPLPAEVDDEEEDEMPSTMATQRRKRGRAKKEASPDSFISSSPPLGPIDSDDDLEIIEQPPKRRARRKNSSSEDLDDEDEDGEPTTPGRRKLKRPPRKFTKQEEDDLADDLEFLEPGSDAESSTRKQRNQSTQKSARQSALEKLKQKRSSQVNQSQPIVVEDGADSEEDQQQPGSPDELYEDDLEDDDEVEEVQQAPMTSRQYFTANEQDEGFIESEGEAEDGVLGYPDPNMPIEFTQFARMKPKQLFPFAVEWFVQKKINPAFSIDDEVYGLTFRKLDDEVKGLAGSKFTSSAWTEAFTFALRARPDIAYEPLDRSGEHWMNDHCDACNRSGHPATYQIQFQGKPYYKETLEEVNNDAEDDDSDSDSHSSEDDNDDDKPSWDSEGRQIVPVTKIFFVGKFCMGNAQTAHALQHWKYHLNEWVVIWLTKNGYLTPEEIVKRDGFNEKKRRKTANRISDRMEREGLVQRLWRDFRGNIDDARDSKQGRW